MGSSRASAGLQVSLLPPSPADPILGMLPPPASPQCSLCFSHGTQEG